MEALTAVLIHINTVTCFVTSCGTHESIQISFAKILSATIEPIILTFMLNSLIQLRQLFLMLHSAEAALS